MVASRLVEAHYRPAIVGVQLKKETRASCRSIPEFNIIKALDECGDLLKRHGGHAMAAGFTIENKNIDEFQALLKIIGERELSGRDLQPSINPDIELKLGEIITGGPIKMVDFLEPTGMGNRGALFISRNLSVKGKKQVGSDKTHLRLDVTDGISTISCIAFRQGHWYDQLPDKVDLIYSLEINSYNGQDSMQFNIKDIKPSVK